MTKKIVGDYHYTAEELEHIESYYEKEYYESMCDAVGVGLGMAGGNVLKHQMIQMRIARNYLKRFDNAILTETRLSDDLRITPDISIWSKYNYKNGVAENPVLTIEITHSTRNDRYSEKTIYASFANFMSLKESFIYNYEQDRWIRYRSENGQVVRENDEDYSQVLHCHLHTLL